MSEESRMSYIRLLAGLTALVSVICTCLPVLSRAQCYEYAVEPSVFDGGCSPIGVSAHFQCSVDITDRRSTCRDHSIRWMHMLTTTSVRHELNETYPIRGSCTIPSPGLLNLTSTLTIPTLQRGQLGYYWCEAFSSSGGKENTLPSSQFSSKIGLVTEPCQQPVPVCTSDVEPYEETTTKNCAIPGSKPTDSFPPICTPTEVNTTWSMAYINPNTNILSIGTSIIAASTVTSVHYTNFNTNHSSALDVSDSTIKVFIYIQAGIALFIVVVIIFGLLICMSLRQRRKGRKDVNSMRSTETEKEVEMEMDLNNAYSTATKFMYQESEVDPMARVAEDKEDDPQSHIYSHVDDCYTQRGNN